MDTLNKNKIYKRWPEHGYEEENMKREIEFLLITA